jgi:DNA repair exonuclease SbcCD ATPase subunit
MKKESLDGLERILYDVETIRTWISDIQSKLESRKEIAKKLMSEIGEDIEKLESKYEKVQFWSPGYNASIDKMKTEIQDEINSLKNHARNEEVRFWDDTSRLEKELRLLVHAYEKAKWRKEMMGD